MVPKQTTNQFFLPCQSCFAVGIFVAFVVLLLAPKSTVAQNAVSQVEQKLERSEVDLSKIRKFVGSHLTRQMPGASIHDFGYETHTVTGQVVDHHGDPIQGALVALVEPIGYSDRSYYEQFDVTDDLGRFRLEAEYRCNRVVTLHSNGVPISQTVKQGSESLLIKWPEPAQVKLKIARELIPKSGQVTLQTTHYWSGMNSLHFRSMLDERGEVTFENLPPADYLIHTRSSFLVGEAEVNGTKLVGTFTIQAGDQLEVAIEPRVGCRVSADPGENFNGGKPYHAVIWQRKRSYSHVDCQVDAYPLVDGKLISGPLPVGEYRMEILGDAPEQANANLGFGSGLMSPRPRIVKYFQVIAGQTELDLSAKGQPEELVDRQIRETMESRPTGSWSHADVQVSNLKAYPNQKEMVASVLQLMGDSKTPHGWRYPLRQYLATCGERDAIVGMVELLKDESRLDTGDLWFWAQVREHVELAMPLIEQYHNHDDYNVRATVAQAMVNFVYYAPSLRTKLEPMLIACLDDPSAEIRIRAASCLGRLKSADALERLVELKRDPDPRVAVAAATAVFKVDGDEQKMAKFMTQKLRSKKLAGQRVAADSLKECKSLDEITIKALLSKARFEEPKQRKRSMLANEQASIKRTAVEALKLHAPDRLPGELVGDD